jgi:hypothetical protein
MQFTKADGISISLLLLLLCFWSPCAAQDPLKVDPAHFRVEFENDQVRVVRVHFGPHYKSPMNEVPPRVVIALTDEHIKVVFPDGTSSSWELKAGTAFWSDGGKGAPENASDQPFELIWVVPKVHSQPTRTNQPRKSGMPNIASLPTKGPNSY